ARLKDQNRCPRELRLGRMARSSSTQAIPNLLRQKVHRATKTRSPKIPRNEQSRLATTNARSITQRKTDDSDRRGHCRRLPGFVLHATDLENFFAAKWRLQEPARRG